MSTLPLCKQILDVLKIKDEVVSDFIIDIFEKSTGQDIQFFIKELNSLDIDKPTSMKLYYIIKNYYNSTQHKQLKQTSLIVILKKVFKNSNEIGPADLETMSNFIYDIYAKMERSNENGDISLFAEKLRQFGLSDAIISDIYQILTSNNKGSFTEIKENKNNHSSTAMLLKNTNSAAVKIANGVQDLSPILNNVYKGIIKARTKFGYFIEILGTREENVEGLCHNNEISVSSSTSQDLRINEPVYVQIIKLQNNGKISLSMKNVNQKTGELIEIDNFNNVDNLKRGRALNRTSTNVYGEKAHVNNEAPRRTLTSPERWEIRQLISSGVSKLEDYPEYQEYLKMEKRKQSLSTATINAKRSTNEHGQINKASSKLSRSYQEEEMPEEEDMDIIMNKNGKPKFLKASKDLKVGNNAGYKQAMTKLVKVPRGSLNRNAINGSRLMNEHRDEKFNKRKEVESEVIRGRNLHDPASNNNNNNISSNNNNNNVRLQPVSMKESRQEFKRKQLALTAWERKRLKEHIEYGRHTNLSIQEQRKSLPVYKMRQELIKSIIENQFLIIIGETGSGKTTQITQYLYEDGFAVNGKVIGCTQPRRVAAISVAKRVAEEMDCFVGEEVGYTIRFEDETSNRTRIKYMTDGMLQREATIDPLLQNYSVILLDEAHERTVATDVLFALLKRAAKERPHDLKIIITSATLDSEKFSNYFNDCPIVKIPGKTFPVEVMYSKTPQIDYIESSLDTVMNIHINEPEGDILVFLTGQEEIDTCCEILYERFTKLEAVLDKKLIILPVYSALPNEIQSKIFEPTPPGSRKVIFATNIAETSITIDGIYYVVDPGFSKINTYNPRIGMEQLIVTPISQAQANQRKGRAGRTGPGKCYRLYTETAFYNEMLPTAIPEIQRQNLSNTVLMLKTIGIDDLINFEFMDPPPKTAIIYALEELYHLQALDEKGGLTELGHKMAQFPMDPELSRSLLASAMVYNCSEEIMIIISMLSVQNIFYRPKDHKSEADRKRAQFVHVYGDHLTLLNVYRKWRLNLHISKKWCNDNYLHERHLKRAHDVYLQLLKIFHKLNLSVISCGGQVDNIRRSLVAGFFRNCSKRADGSTYKTIVDNTEVAIHPTSTLFGKEYEYLLYNNLMMTTREYMSIITVIEPKWLLECAPHFYKAADERSKKRVKIEPLRGMFGGKDKRIDDRWRLTSKLKSKGDVLGHKQRK
ncbi:related to Pre-mRNA-splicing factor ATP-dependent RNA helicase PRP22 [Saccharomycodes ludwigii]|uniref:RNA helicase n=1 Tax=Saccharomycodes ludwigii TaxID=36035 RepID=A0A376B7C9_9ASCO|nr:hypothetical protein SCDLUD_005195 [Saccharomycodes ludwigii]KAH3898856.1 hypothetical protein SCDLUD_005195 [Saccharomycodes ludwigii]SSD60595.1 related to Pre-mRNA-splicing factor ATP-dependent RNA helicase PRP22 [Saccharomycodes ludwigii]